MPPHRRSILNIHRTATRFMPISATQSMRRSLNQTRISIERDTNSTYCQTTGCFISNEPDLSVWVPLYVDQNENNPASHLVEEESNIRYELHTRVVPSADDDNSFDGHLAIRRDSQTRLRLFEIDEEEDDEDINSEERVLEIGRELEARVVVDVPDLDDEREVCAICLDQLSLREQKEIKIVRLDCRHKYHMECIKNWLTRKNFCPVCKSPALPGVFD